MGGNPPHGDKAGRGDPNKLPFFAAVATREGRPSAIHVDLKRYFAEILTRLVNGWPNSRVDELMPWYWAVSRST